jgi:hemerythrin-like domain-containing protein
MVPMRLIDELKREHELIDPAVGSFRSWSEAFACGEATQDEGRAYLRFFVEYAGAFHHEREESILCPALIRDASLPQRGPIAVLLDDHAAMAQQLASIGDIIAGECGADERERLRQLVIAYSHALWHHIDAENSVFLPESEARLQRAGIRELDGREPSAAETEIAATMEGLILRYPPFEDREVVRGEGCIMCPAFASSCRGIEREWWNQWEWKEHDEHVVAS